MWWVKVRQKIFHYKLALLYTMYLGIIDIMNTVSGTDVDALLTLQPWNIDIQSTALGEQLTGYTEVFLTDRALR